MKLNRRDFPLLKSCWKKSFDIISLENFYSIYKLKKLYLNFTFLTASEGFVRSCSCLFSMDIRADLSSVQVTCVHFPILLNEIENKTQKKIENY